MEDQITVRVFTANTQELLFQWSTIALTILREIKSKSQTDTILELYHTDITKQVVRWLFYASPHAVYRGTSLQIIWQQMLCHEKRIQIAQQHPLSDYTSVMNNLGKETEQNTWKIDSSTKMKGTKSKCRNCVHTF